MTGLRLHSDCSTDTHHLRKDECPQQRMGDVPLTVPSLCPLQASEGVWSLRLHSLHVKIRLPISWDGI